MKQAYIIIGAAGHLARTIIMKLNPEMDVIRGLVLPHEPQEFSQVDYFKGDITQPETLVPLFQGLEDCQVNVIHTAAIISISEEVSDTIYQVNVNGTKNVIKACQDFKVNRLIYVSSVHAMPELPGLQVMREIAFFDPAKADGAYGKTKAEATQAVLDATKNGLPAIVVHPSGIIGPYDDGNNHTTELIQMYMAKKLPAAIAGGYDFVDVRDVADGILSAVYHGRIGETYLLTNRYIAIPDLVECMRRAIPGRKKVPTIPLGVVKLALPVVGLFSKLTGKRALFTKQSLSIMESNGHFSHEKATNELGYHPRPIQETVTDTIQYLQER